MAQLVFILLLVGQIFFFYTKIMDYPLRKYNNKSWFKIALIIIIIIILAIISYYKGRKLGLVILVSLGIPLLLDCDLKIAYGLFFPVVGLCLSSNTIWNFIIYDISDVLVKEQKRIICLLITYALLFAVSFFRRYKQVSIRTVSFSKNDLFIINILTLFIGIALGGIDVIQKGRESIKTFNVYISVTTVLCVVLYVLSIYLIFLNIRMVAEKNKSIYQQITLESQKEQIGAVLESEKRLHAYRHDLNAHLSALQYLAENNDTNGIKEYCEKLLEYSQGFRNVIISGNTAVDGILGRELEKSKAKGIDLQLQVMLLENNKISDYEMCIIFSNILNNAIDACSEGDEVKLACYPYNEYLCIISENPIKKELVSINNDIETTKEDKVHHGYGIKNIRAVVDKYDGMMKITSKDGVFSIEILI